MVEIEELQQEVEKLWAGRDDISYGDPHATEVIESVMDLLEDGSLRVAQWDGTSGDTVVNLWVKYAILLMFKVHDNEVIINSPFTYRDKVSLRSANTLNKVRLVPGAIVRRGCHIGDDAVLMPSFVNTGAYVGDGTMVDTWATVGSCAQVGSRVHLAGGVGIGGVLEPPQALPVMIGDDVFIGSRSMITQGAKVGTGAVLGEGTLLNPSIPVIDADSGNEISRGVIPPWCVALQAQRRKSFKGGEFFLPCVLVVRYLTTGERLDKAALESILREHGLG
jgi:2,3,4,5-tetrahydropyridine-2-carboxylate N-succinyltransferase